jgi:hypothetical protein
MNLNKKFGWQDIEGWFGFQQIYDTIIREAAQNDQLIEVGSGLGKSTCYLASRAKLSGKQVNITAVDRFGDKLYRKFVENMTRAGVVDLLSIIPLSTANAAQNAYDDSIFAIFAIGRQTTLEIQTWYSKIKPGGLIGGCGPAPKDMKNCKVWKGKNDVWSAWTARKPMA